MVSVQPTLIFLERGLRYGVCRVIAIAAWLPCHPLMCIIIVDVGNLNAPVAVTLSAILYSLRCLVDDDIPLNEGCFRPVTVNIPRGKLSLLMT